MPARLNGWLWVVAHAVRDFAVPLFLATSSTLLLANLIWGEWELGSMPMASAYMVVLIVIVVVLVFVGRGRLGAAQGWSTGYPTRIESLGPLASPFIRP